MIKVGSDFSGVGAFIQALLRLQIKHKEVFACDMDKYARETYLNNYEAPDDFPEDVYLREIPEEPLDIYMTSPPCQAFSLAGKRKGEDDKRGVLFYNSHDFIKENKPRYFIFENVKGLLSDDKTDKKSPYGRTFNRWLDYLGGKSVNGNPVIFPREDSTPYHIYHFVLNAKNYGVPQNRERVFIVGIRDDKDNQFNIPKPFPLKKRLKDVLEENVDEKYFLSDKMVKGLMKEKSDFKGRFKPKTGDETHANAITTRAGNTCTDNFIKVGFINQDTQASQVYNEDGISPTISAGTHGYANGYVEAKIGAIRGRNPNNPKSRVSGLPTEQMLEINENGTSNALTTVQKDNVLVAENRIRRLTPRECFRLMDFPDSFMDKLFEKEGLYLRFICSKFNINKKETQWNAKLKIVKDKQIPEDLETYVLCTTKECQKLEQLKTSFTKTELKENPLNVNFAIEKLAESEQKECVINIIKWTDYTEILYMLKKKGVNQVVVDISETQKEIKSTETLWKISWEENLSEAKLYIILILLKQIMISKIYTYAKTPQNTRRYISSIVNYEKKSEKLHLSFLKMEYTKQLISDTMLYKQAGNSIVVECIVQIIKNLKL